MACQLLAPATAQTVSISDMLDALTGTSRLATAQKHIGYWHRDRLDAAQSQIRCWHGDRFYSWL